MKNSFTDEDQIVTYQTKNFKNAKTNVTQCDWTKTKNDDDDMDRPRTSGQESFTKYQSKDLRVMVMRYA